MYCTCMYVLLVCSFLTRWKYNFSMLQTTGYTGFTSYSQVTARLHVKLARQVMGDRLYCRLPQYHLGTENNLITPEINVLYMYVCVVSL